MVPYWSNTQQQYDRAPYDSSTSSIVDDTCYENESQTKDIAIVTRFSGLVTSITEMTILVCMSAFEPAVAACRSMSPR